MEIKVTIQEVHIHIDGGAVESFQGDWKEVLLKAVKEFEVGSWKPEDRSQKAEIQRCRVCGCTEDDCHQCIEKTGEPCYWIDDDLCSACENHNGNTISSEDGHVDGEFEKLPEIKENETNILRVSEPVEQCLNQEKQSLKCKECGVDFIPTSHRNKSYCGSECAKIADNRSKHAYIVKTKKTKMPAEEVSSPKRQKARTAASKVCRKCGIEYKPTSNVQKDCVGCRTNKTTKTSTPLVQDRQRAQKKADLLSSQGRPLSICLECSTKFEASRKSQKYCSPLCEKYSLAKEPKGKTKNCQKCGAEFLAKNNVQKYCSFDCSHEAEKASKTRYRLAHRPKNMWSEKASVKPEKIVGVELELLECPVCHNDFRPNFPTQKFCSSECTRK